MAETEAPATPDLETDPTKEWHKTACVLCSANCGLEVRIDGREIVRVRGDKEHPSSRGYTCEKGLRINHYQNGRDRLTAPLKKLEDESINTCITSPPYWGLRDYNGEEKQLGLEETPEEFVENLVNVFREVKRVLRDDGTVWLNLGDSYSSGGRTTTTNQTLRGDKDYGVTRPKPSEGIKPKDLIGIPWRVAFALQADGFYLR